VEKKGWRLSGSAQPPMIDWISITKENRKLEPRKKEFRLFVANEWDHHYSPDFWSLCCGPEKDKVNREALAQKIETVGYGVTE